MIKRIISVLILVLLLVACEKDWNTLEKWEELYVVYGTFNLKDTAQYIRINKVFTTNNNPYDLISVADCVHISSSDFKVELEQWQDGNKIGPSIPMNPSIDYQKEGGDFSIENYAVFKTTHRLVYDSEYKLRIKQLNTGYEMSAVIKTFGRRTLHQSFLEKRYFNSAQYKPEPLDYNGSLIPTQFEKMIQRLLYLEIIADDTLERVLDWRPWLDHYKQSAEDTVLQLNDDYFTYISEQIPVNQNIKRIAVGVDKLLILNCVELELFMDLSSANSSLHYNPEYSNFNRGAGFVGFRYYYTSFAMDLKDETLDSLSFGRYTKELNFADAQGVWH